MIRQRGKDAFDIAIDNGKDNNGKRIRLYERFRGSKKEAKAREAEIRSQMKYGTYVINNDYTIKSYFEKWLQEYAKPTLKPKTVESYYAIAKELIAFQGSIKLKSLSALNLLSYYNHLRERGNNQKEVRDQNKRLTENTVLRHYAVINVALKHAVHWQLLAYNPNERVNRPKKVNVESKFYDLEQTHALLKALDCEHIKIPSTNTFSA